MKMIIGERVIQGKIKPREEARELYNQAKQQGKTASLLDQERPNIFTQSVANILPGDDIRVELSYFQDLSYIKGRYEFVFPMVVGPRYIPGQPVGQSGKGWSPDTDRVPDASRISPPLLPPGVRSGHDIQVRVELDAGMPFRDLETPSHSIRVNRESPSRAIVSLSPQNRIPNKDLILRWKVDQDGPVTGWLAHKDETGGTFLLLLQPELKLSRSEIAPREYVFVIDTSGSMHGFPLEQCKRIMKKCLKDLKPADRFQVILFAGSATTLAPEPVTASPQNVRRAIAFVSNANGGGGTEFLPALEKALKAPEDPERSRIVLFLSDGYIGYETAVLKYVHQNRGSANLFPLGVGSSVNRYLIEGMGRMGQGESFYLTPDEDPAPVVNRFFEVVSRPSLTNIEVAFKGCRISTLRPEKLPDLFAGRPLSLVGKYENGGRCKIIVTGWLAGKRWKQSMDVTLPDRETDQKGLSCLWARRSIEGLSDLQAIGEISEKKGKERITELALKYSLMSAYTSFVAIDSQVRNKDGEAQTVAVPVPLPDQVSPYAAPGHAYVGGAGALGFSSMKNAKKGLLCQRLAAPPPASHPVRTKEAMSYTGRDALSEDLAEPEEEAKVEKDVPAVVIEEVRVRGTLDEAEVRRVLEKAVKKWSRERCMAGLQGTLVLSLEVLPSGKACHVRIRDAEDREEMALKCLIKKAQRLSFSGTQAKTHIHVKLSFH